MAPALGRDIESSLGARAGEPPLGAPSRWPAGRLRLRFIEGGQGPTFAEEVRQGLTASPKVLQPKYFYDELGSLLFGAICALPEYYVFRAEMEILRASAGEIAAWLQGPVRIIELGSGDARKTRLIIDAVLARQGGFDYLPIDVSRTALEHSSEELLSAYPNLRVTGWVGDYQEALRAIREEQAAAVPLPKPDIKPDAIVVTIPDTTALKDSIAYCDTAYAFHGGQRTSIDDILAKSRSLI